MNSNEGMDPGSVTRAISQPAKVDDEAVRLLWSRFFDRICQVAKPKIYDRHRRFMDPEDIAGSVMFALVEGLRCGSLDSVKNRHELWNIAVTIATRKAANKAKFFDRKKRGGKRLVGGSAFDGGTIEKLSELLSGADDPARLVEFKMTCCELLQSLPDDVYREIALMRMAGFSNLEIGNKLACSTRTIDRKLEAIRDVWNDLGHE